MEERKEKKEGRKEIAYIVRVEVPFTSLFGGMARLRTYDADS